MAEAAVMNPSAQIDPIDSLSFVDDFFDFDFDFDFDSHLPLHDLDSLDPLDAAAFSFDDFPPLPDDRSLSPGDPPPHGLTAEESKRETTSSSSLKRKTGDGDASPSPASSKTRRSSPSSEADSPSPCVFSCDGQGEEKRRLRLMRNRESAQLSRQRKKQYVEELESKVRSMQSTIADLNSRISSVVAENTSLRQQLASAGGGNPTALPLVAPVYFPWPQGPLGPLIPIPRLKPQKPAPAPRAKKGREKTRKVASMSLLGVLLVMLAFSGLLPGLNLRYRGSGDLSFDESGLSARWQDRVWRVSGRTASSNESGGIEHHNENNGWGEGGPTAHHNTSETLPALLYVPRNGKHVKINGNLVIHSALASERAMAERALVVQNEKGTALATSDDAVSALGVSSDSGNTYGDNLESVSADGSLQQWFFEGLAGPILHSGRCNEVFRFDVSPASSGIVPAASVVNVTDKLPAASSNPRMMKNRRILRSQLMPLTASSSENRTEHLGKPSNGSHPHANGSVPPMVVSVLVDPRENDEVGSDGMNPPRTLSRIFVVVLLDSVKYITYSCVLPMKGSSAHHVKHYT